MSFLVACYYHHQSWRVIGVSNEKIQELFDKENDIDTNSFAVRRPKSCLGKAVKCIAHLLSCGTLYLIKTNKEANILAKHKIVTETWGDNFVSRSRATPSLDSIKL